MALGRTGGVAVPPPDPGGATPVSAELSARRRRACEPTLVGLSCRSGRGGRCRGGVRKPLPKDGLVARGLGARPRARCAAVRMSSSSFSRRRSRASSCLLRRSSLSWYNLRWTGPSRLGAGLSGAALVRAWPPRLGAPDSPSAGPRSGAPAWSWWPLRPPPSHLLSEDGTRVSCWELPPRVGLPTRRWPVGERLRS